MWELIEYSEGFQLSQVLHTEFVDWLHPFKSFENFAETEYKRRNNNLWISVNKWFACIEFISQYSE